MRLHSYVYTQQSPSHMWIFASLWASRPLCEPWMSPTYSPLPYGPFLSSTCHHGPPVCHPWKPRVNPARTSMETPYVHIHGNLMSHHYLASLATLLCWVFSQDRLCGVVPKPNSDAFRDKGLRLPIYLLVGFLAVLWVVASNAALIAQPLLLTWF